MKLHQIGNKYTVISRTTEANHRIYIGLDLRKQSSQFCILTEDRKVFELRIRTEYGRFVERLGKRQKCKVLPEASTEREWVARCIEELGYEVVVADPNFAPMYATRNRKIETDKTRCQRAMRRVPVRSVPTGTSAV